MKKIKIMCIYAIWFGGVLERENKGKTLVIEFN